MPQVVAIASSLASLVQTILRSALFQNSRVTPGPVLFGVHDDPQASSACQPSARGLNSDEPGH